MRTVWRLVGATLLASVVVLAGPAPADAHTITGLQPTNYRTTLTGLRPALPGVTVRLLDLGRRIRVTNTGRTDVLIAGYQNEAYLRIGPSGVFENERSPSVYLNRVATGSPSTTTTLPAIVDATKPAKWKRVSSGRTATWRDRRTRWEGKAPASVLASPGQTQVVRTWSIAVGQGRTTAEITGRLLWIPPPSATPWLLLALALFVATVLAAFTRWWPPLLAIALALLVANDVVHTFASAASASDPLPVELAKVLLGGFYATAAWVVGIVVIGGLQQGRDTAAIGAGAAGLLIGLLGGVTDATGLGKSEVPFVFSATMARAEVAVTMGLGFGLAAAVAWLFFGMPRLLGRSAFPERAESG